MNITLRKIEIEYRSFSVPGLMPEIYFSGLMEFSSTEMKQVAAIIHQFAMEHQMTLANEILDNLNKKKRKETKNVN